ncbi:MAG: polysaccharide deacetylase family protein [Actinomycetota bacterium]|nr:polysaccharide deacetylase family protein [Actinomycetota bacterium]
MPLSSTRPARVILYVLAFALILLAIASVGNPAEAVDNDCPAGWVALTYDDGPVPERTDAILAALDLTGTRATFFSVGRRVARNPAVALAVARRGHVITNHTWAHPDLTSLSDEEIVASVQRTDVALRAIGIQPLRLLRPPFLSTDERVLDALERAGFTQVLENLNPKDWSGISAAEIADRVVTAARDGSVIGLHDGGKEYEATAAATEVIVDRLTDDGFCFGVLDQDGNVVPPPARDTTTYDVPEKVVVDENVWVRYFLTRAR